MVEAIKDHVHLVDDPVVGRPASLVVETEVGVTEVRLTPQGLHVGSEAASDVTEEPLITSGQADPSAGDGVPAPQGSLYLRTNGEHWAKTGAGDTAWDQMAVVA
jgi:hypothetical protein